MKISHIMSVSRIFIDSSAIIKIKNIFEDTVYDLLVVKNS